MEKPRQSNPWLFGSGVRLLAILAVLAAGPARAQSAYRVIVNPANPVERMTRDELSEVFLKKKIRWDNGVAVEAVDLGKKSAVREAFSLEILGRDLTSLERYWTRQVFSGREVPPQEVGSEAEALAFVRSRAGGVGYVSAGAKLDGVKAVSVYVPPRVVTRTAEPTYTEAAREARERGKVVLRVTIDARGRPTELTPLQTLRFGLTEQAVAAVRQWAFEPATLDGKPEPGTIDVAVTFIPD